MGIIIAGERSGVGKTTITLALLAALRQRGKTVQAYKVGPDYIDPMFHRALTQRPAYNLDPVLTSEAYVQRCYRHHLAGAEVAVVEGVMGLFDGAGGGDRASTAHIARLLDLPVVLVVDCSRLSRSVAALVQGYRSLDPRVHLAGIVLNRVGSDRHRAMLTRALADLGVPVVGIFQRDGDLTLPDRHLGLVPTDELPDLARRFDHLAQQGEAAFHWEALAPLLAIATSPVNIDADISPLAVAETSAPPPAAPPVRIGIARDRAFNFYYADNLAALEQAGAVCIPFSPLADTAPPPQLDGLYLGGGFPEMFGADLAANTGMRSTLAAQLAAGLPTIAECGGLMYLGRSLTDFSGQAWPMVGALPLDTTMTGRLRLGYRQATAHQSSPLVPSGLTLWGHEFHRSAPTAMPHAALFHTTPYPIPGQASPTAVAEGRVQGAIHASYVHLHWGDRPELPARFVTHCRQFRHQRPPAER
jgi:cobyrinic acid a,c-diamide synthase